MAIKMCNFNPSKCFSLFSDYDYRYMKEWTWWILCLLVIQILGCDSVSKEERSAMRYAARVDSMRKADQMTAWKIYAEDLYYYRKEPRSTFAPVSARDPKPSLPPGDFLSGNPAGATSTPAPQRDEAVFPLGSVVRSSHSIKVVTSRPLQFKNRAITLASDQFGLIGEIATTVNLNPEKFKVSIVGYVADWETDPENQSLDKWQISSMRAAYIVKELVKRGVSPHHLEAVGKASFTMSSDTVRSNIDVFLSPINSRD